MHQAGASSGPWGIASRTFLRRGRSTSKLIRKHAEAGSGHSPNVAAATRSLCSNLTWVPLSRRVLGDQASRRKGSSRRQLKRLVCSRQSACRRSVVRVRNRREAVLQRRNSRSPSQRLTSNRTLVRWSDCVRRSCFAAPNPYSGGTTHQRGRHHRVREVPQRHRG